VNNAVTRSKTGLAVFEAFMILLALAFIFPTLYVLVNAFKSTQEIVLNPVGLPSHWTLDNFANVLTREGAGGYTFFSSLWNTVILTAFSVAGVVVLSAMAAYALVRNKTRTSGAVFSMFTFFLVIPFQVIMVPLVVLATDLGSQGVLGLVVMYWGLGVPGAIFMYHGFIKSVPLSLEESASMDGAGQWTVFFRIVFPLLTPITATVGILDILWVWNDFLLPYIVLRQGTLVLFQFNFFGQFTNDFGALTASLVLSAAPVLVLYFSLQKYIVKGIAAGAVKG
jgi:raffinose/stachyose/melibiose transport system permease protein